VASKVKTAGKARYNATISHSDNAEFENLK
jgi:hypothetical protein